MGFDVSLPSAKTTRRLHQRVEAPRGACVAMQRANSAR
jgi:hypothetical protein